MHGLRATTLFLGRVQIGQIGEVVYDTLENSVIELWYRKCASLNVLYDTRSATERHLILSAPDHEPIAP